MSALFKKLNLKDQSDMLVLNAPESFARLADALSGIRVCSRRGEVKKTSFFVAFAKTRRELDGAAKAAASKTEGDAVVWIAYPKKSSKRYTCEFDRDHGWEEFGTAGFEPVRVVAIDEDWSALRFRRVEFIKTTKRDPKRALTKSGKSRAR